MARKDSGESNTTTVHSIRYENASPSAGYKSNDGKCFGLDRFGSDVLPVSVAAYHLMRHRIHRSASITRGRAGLLDLRLDYLSTDTGQYKVFETKRSTTSNTHTYSVEQ